VFCKKSLDLFENNGVNFLGEAKEFRTISKERRYGETEERFSMGWKCSGQEKKCFRVVIARSRATGKGGAGQKIGSEGAAGSRCSILYWAER
jgi:hypothetical protein